MAINIQNIIAALEAKVAAATSATETQELIVIIKSIKAAGQQTIVTYANVAALPTASTDNQGNLAFVADVGKIYYSNSTTWAELGSGSGGGGASLNAGTNIVLTPETDGSITISSTGGSVSGDIVADSALIGNVVIVDNTIAGVDNYGNTDNLIVNSDFAVQANVTSTTQNSFADSTKNVYYDPYAAAGKKLQFSSQYQFWSVEQLDKLKTIVAGTIINFTIDGAYGVSSGTFTVKEVQSAIDYYGFPYVDMYIENVNATNDGWVYVGQPITNVNFTWNNSSTNVVDIMSIDANGVSFQTFKSTTDLDLTFDSRSTVTTSYTNSQLNYGAWSHSGTMSGDGSGKQIVGRAFMPSAPTDILNSFSAGDKLTFKIYNAMLMEYVDYTVTLTSPFAYSMNENGYVASVLEKNTGMMGIDFSSNIDPVIVKTISTGGLNSYTFGVDGALVAPSIIADSGLIGDVSIIGNTIAALDSYGNPDVLNVSASDIVSDSNLNLVINSLVTSTTTVFPGGASQFEVSGGYFKNMSAPSSWADASYLKNGSIVTLPSSMNGNYVIKLTSDMTYDMMNGWRATYSVISGTNSPMYTSAIVETSTGASVNYGFNDNGEFTAPAISTNSLLINGSTPSFFTVNQDGSKSIEVQKTIVTNYSGLYWMQARLTDVMGSSQYQGKLRFENPNQSVIDLFSSLVPGDKVTITRDLQPGTQEYTFTVQTAGFNYDMMANAYILDIVETNTEMSEYYFAYSYGVSVQTIGSQEYNFAGDGLTASNIIADSALIGDVSIVGNTIAGLDSYGLPNKLVVEGDLEVEGDLTSTTDLSVTINKPIESATTYTNSMPNDWSSMDAFVTTWNESYFPELFGQKVFRITLMSYTSPLQSSLIGLVAGDQLELPGWSGAETTRVTLAAPFQTYDNGSSLQLAVLLTSDSPSNGSAPTSIKLIKKSVQTASYGFGADGALVLPSTTEGPLNPSSPVTGAWAKVSIGGQTYFMPLYQ